MTVTTGGRGCSSAVACAVASPRGRPRGRPAWRPSRCGPFPATTIIAVSWSSTWLMVTMLPSFISTLMTSAAFTDILCARSPTVMVSGTGDLAHLGLGRLRERGLAGRSLAAVASRRRRDRASRRRRRPVAAGLDRAPARGVVAQRRVALLDLLRPSCRPSARRPCGRLCSVPSVAAAPPRRPRGLPALARVGLRLDQHSAPRSVAAPRPSCDDSFFVGAAISAEQLLLARGTSSFAQLQRAWPSAPRPLPGARRARPGAWRRPRACGASSASMIGARRRRRLRRLAARARRARRLHEHALLAHLDLDRARLAGRVGLLDLAGLLARQRDLLLRLDGAVRLAQVVEQPRLVRLR